MMHVIEVMEVIVIVILGMIVILEGKSHMSSSTIEVK